MKPEPRNVKQALQDNYEKYKIPYLKHLEVSISSALGNQTHKDPYLHTVEYSKKKATQYHKKYQVNIYKYAYQTKPAAGSVNTKKETIHNILRSDSAEAVGFYALDQSKLHVDSFIVYNKKRPLHNST